MANNVFQVKRTNVSGRTPNTTGSYGTNSQYIAAGEFALNMADGILYSSNGSAVIEIGANNTNQRITNSLTINNNKNLNFATVNTSAAVSFIQQTDDNFVMYTTNTAYGQRAVWSIFANSITSEFSFSAPVRFNANITALTANGTQGSAGQYLTSNGSTVYWSSPGVSSVNTAAQWNWTNIHTFAANVSFTGNGIGLTTNTGAIYLGGLADANWKIGRNTGVVTKWRYTNNSIDIITANSNLEGMSIGLVSGNSYFETGYLGTFIASNVTIGNASSNATINSTAFSGTANNSTNLGGQAAAYYTNATNITTGTLPYAQIPANIINTTAAFTISGVHTYNANVVIGTAAGISANGGFGTAGQVLHSNGTSVYWAADDNSGGTVTSITMGNGLSSTQSPLTTSGTMSVVAGTGGGLVSNSTGVFVTQGTGTVVNATGVHVNATYIGTISANNASFLGGTAAAGYQTTAGLAANVATLTANNTSFVGTVSAANVVSNAQLSANLGNYQTTAGLAANVATLTSNNTSFVGTVSAANVVSNAQLSANLANYQTTAGLAGNVATLTSNNATNFNGQPASFYTNASNISTGTLPWAQAPTGTVNTSGNFTLSGNTTLAGTNTTISSNLNVTGSFLNVASVFVVNSTGGYHTGTINAASHTVGTSTVANSIGVYTGIVNATTHSSGATFTANSTLVNAAAINITGRVNTATFFATTSANVGTAVVANSIGVTTTGFVNSATVVNSAAYTIGTTLIANTLGVYHTGTVNSAVLSTGTTFIANATQITITLPFSANGSTGSSGQVLTSNGATGSPYWSTVASGGGVYMKGGSATVGSLGSEGQNLFRVNANTLNYNTTIATGENAQATGPITVASGITLTVESGARVAIV